MKIVLTKSPFDWKYVANLYDKIADEKRRNSLSKDVNLSRENLCMQMSLVYYARSNASGVVTATIEGHDA